MLNGYLFIISYYILLDISIYTTIQLCWVVKAFLMFLSLLCSPELHLFDQNAAKTVILWNMIPI